MSSDSEKSGTSMTGNYVGRFAPSPTGPLHAGSLVAALASYLDARAHDGRWLLRIEDIDPPREVAGAADGIIDILLAFGFTPDGPITFQSRRQADYELAFAQLQARGAIYPCACTRREIADSLLAQGSELTRHQERVYPGTCRHGLSAGRSARAWRVKVEHTVITWQDRARAAPYVEPLAERVGDFVLRRADGLWAYQLAVVVDDQAQGVTHVVRGDDLLESTARQIHLQQLLGYVRPAYLHLPVVRDHHGEKLSKQTGAQALEYRCALDSLEAAMVHLGLAPTGAGSLATFWPEAIARWRQSAWMTPA